jgi:hypothetical protein
MANNTQVDSEMGRVIADVPMPLREEIDSLGSIVDMKMGPIVREALERFMPELRKRAAARLRIREKAQEVSLNG